MSDLPNPLVFADVDLRDFPFMPLDVARLRDSDLAAVVSAEAFRAAVMLWCAAWHQVPAGSLPAEEQALARLAGYGRDLTGWRKAKDGALRGFVACSDGRLYHLVVAEKAVHAWEAKQAQRARTEAARAARLAKQQASDNVCDRGSHEERDSVSGKDRNNGRNSAATGSKGEGEGERDIKDTCPKRVRTRHAYSADFDQFWAAYPTDPNMGKREAFDAWQKLTDDERRQALASCRSFKRHCEANPTYRPIHAYRYLAKRRFEGHAEASMSNGRDDHRIDFGGGISWPEATVLDRVAHWRRDPTTWPTDRIGPPPGTPGCKVPDRLLEIAA